MWKFCSLLLCRGWLVDEIRNDGGLGWLSVFIYVWDGEKVECCSFLCMFGVVVVLIIVLFISVNYLGGRTLRQAPEGFLFYFLHIMFFYQFSLIVVIIKSMM